VMKVRFAPRISSRGAIYWAVRMVFQARS